MSKLHDIFSFERYMVVFKKYVCKHSSTEGYIAKGYGTNEVIEFYVDFINELMHSVLTILMNI
jgi:hypothetical protein